MAATYGTLFARASPASSHGSAGHCLPSHHPASASSIFVCLGVWFTRVVSLPSSGYRIMASRYTLVVSSPSAKVVSLDMPALRSWLLTSHLGREAAADVVAAVAEVDIALYGRAVKQIAVQVSTDSVTQAAAKSREG
jgi:hypothetical protein